MPEIKPMRSSAIADERLTQLIRLKRIEKPPPAFWLSFEQEFRSRQLSSFVRIQPWHTRLRRLCAPAARRATPSAAVVGAIAVTLVALTNTSYLADLPTPNDRPAISEAEPVTAPITESPEAFFVVKSDGAAKQEKDEFDSIFGGLESATYQINSLSAGPSAEHSYQLMTTPVTFSHGRGDGSASTQIGAKIIRTKPNP